MCEFARGGCRPTERNPTYAWAVQILHHPYRVHHPPTHLLSLDEDRGVLGRRFSGRQDVVSATFEMSARMPPMDSSFAAVVAQRHPLHDSVKEAPLIASRHLQISCALCCPSAVRGNAERGSPAIVRHIRLNLQQPLHNINLLVSGCTLPPCHCEQICLGRKVLRKGSGGRTK